MRRFRLLVAPVLLVLFALYLALPGHAVKQAHAQQQGAGMILTASGWNISSVTSGGTVFATNLTAKTPGSILRICVVLGTAAPLSIFETDGTHTFTSYLNGGTALTAGCYYTFLIEARCSTPPGGPTSNPTAFNFVVGGPTTVPVLRVTECTSGSVD